MLEIKMEVLCNDVAHLKSSESRRQFKKSAYIGRAQHVLSLGDRVVYQPSELAMKAMSSTSYYIDTKTNPNWHCPTCISKMSLNLKILQSF